MDPEQKNKTLVIGEDEPDLREALVEVLSAEGYTVHQAGDGEVALNLALEHHPDLVMLDLHMPKLGGLETLQQLRQDEWGAKVHVVILTAQSDMDSVSDAVEFGGMNMEYLIKTDWKLADVVSKVKEKLGDA